MLNHEILADVLKCYKKDFREDWWPGEKYKWEAVQCFQEHWNLNAPDFAEMFTKATEKTRNLLASYNYFPRGMIQQFAKKEPETVRTMFAQLYDETRGLTERIANFQSAARELWNQFKDEEGWKRHFQNSNSISTYLWLRFPDKYYLYKYTVFRTAAETLQSDYVPKQETESVANGFLFYDEICKQVAADSELIQMFQDVLTPDCYSDPAFHTLTMDVGFYICNKYRKTEQEPEPEPESEPDSEPEVCAEPYTQEDFLSEVFLSSKQLKTLLSLLERGKNLILQGAPGVGKTFAAKRLAYVMMGEKDESRIQTIQFHQNYAYEDFMMGYKPTGEGFQLSKGVFYKFCKLAEQEPDRPFFFLIDEINRGNMSKIFGELLLLIEKEYRGTSITLAYQSEPFCVPKNLYLIGMMNTADRSLAMIDYALRRRFRFFEMEPGFQSEGFMNCRKSLNDPVFDRLIEKMIELNEEIASDSALGPSFRIGHSYFCGPKQGDCTWMEEVVEYEILPLLQEYWFDDSDRVTEWSRRLRGIFHD